MQARRLKLQTFEYDIMTHYDVSNCEQHRVEFSGSSFTLVAPIKGITNYHFSLSTGPSITFLSRWCFFRYRCWSNYITIYVPYAAFWVPIDFFEFRVKGGICPRSELSVTHFSLAMHPMHILFKISTID